MDKYEGNENDFERKVKNVKMVVDEASIMKLMVHERIVFCFAWAFGVEVTARRSNSRSNVITFNETNHEIKTTRPTIFQTSVQKHRTPTQLPTNRPTRSNQAHEQNDPTKPKPDRATICTVKETT
jgi:hypothetical protein